MLAPFAAAQRIATLTVPLDVPVPAEGVPVSAEVALPDLPEEAALGLYEVRGVERESVPLQWEAGGRKRLHWLVAPRADGAATRVYELARLPVATSVPRPEMNLVDRDGVLTLRAGERELLGYQHAVQQAPAGESPLYARSGFIHPLRAPHGQVLTQIQPVGDFHHYGLWAPWPRVGFEGREIDFWNLGDGKGTVRFARFAATSEGPVFAEYQAEQEHVVLAAEGGEKVALREVQTVRVYRMLAVDAYLLDLTIVLRCAGAVPVTLLDYRYGGPSWRPTAEWSRTNSEMLTSEGLARPAIDGSRARWCLVQGEVAGGSDYAGAAWLAHPGNFNSPEPMRVWPEDKNGRGDVFVNFAPAKGRDWLLEPGKGYVLRYRFLVFNGHRAAEAAEGAWRGFAKPAVVRVE